MRQRVSIAAIVCLAFVHWMATVTASTSDTAFVTNSKDAGPGSFRDAILSANSNPAITRVQFYAGVSTVRLRETVEFSGPQDLAVAGNGATLDGSKAGGDPAFVVSGGGSLAVSGLTVWTARERRR